MESDYDFQEKRKGFLPYKVGYLTDCMVKLAEEELDETEETRSQAISELRSLIAGKWDPDQFSMPIFISASTFLLLQCIEDPATQVCGIQLIIDAKNTSLKHNTRALTPRYLQLLAKALRVSKYSKRRKKHFNQSFTHITLSHI
ncbi:uncharacterized protein [Parasteatoda tepidariorum]|uniref:uncharacterized protein isoform X2 n=1 Tax=Parasteatoda tepidariorum TaxID=114398 RepID=UPI0039BC75F8